MMNDLVFLDSVYWLFNSYDFKLYLIGTVSFVALLVSFFHIIRKWGDL